VSAPGPAASVAAGFFRPGGRLAGVLPAYEDRTGQADLAGAVAETLAAGGALLAEAGTGTGKTLAYLVPALLSGRRVIVSTGTRNLQDQILARELPFLRDAAGLAVSAAVLKGRDNYLCRLRLAELAREPLLEDLAEAPWVDRLVAWGRETEAGDRAEIADLPDRLRLWRDVNARAETCAGPSCPEYEPCWLTRAKRRAQQAQVVVVNHHLFFADLALRTAYGAVLPDYDTVVFDEAHLLEEIATLYFGQQVSSAQFEDLAREVERLAARPGGAAAAGAGPVLRRAAEEFFRPLRECLATAPGRVPREPPGRGGPVLARPGADLAAALADVEAVAGTPAAGDERAQAAARRAAQLREALAFVVGREDPAFVYGLERRGRSVVLSAAPVDVSAPMREGLFAGLHACVLTSATMTVRGSFAFFARRLGLEDARTLTVASAFDHAAQAVLYLPRGLPDPGERTFLPRALEEIEALLDLAGGRAFLLFTSLASMQHVHEALRRIGRWPLFLQGEGSKVALTEAFRSTPGAVLLGSTSFWHGVDVPGAALSLVVIDRLPFDVPSDPLVAARIERVRDRGGDAFEEYQLPLAVIELKQGLGRLLRTRADRGVLCVLDPRLTTRRYGATFLESLPPYRIVRERGACAAMLGR